MVEKYSFNDWFFGAINLDTEPLFNIGEEKPIVVNLTNFSELDQKRLLEEKRVIFNKKVEYILDGFKKEFISRLDNSNYKLRLLNSHIKESFAILNEKVPNDELIKTKYWNILFAKDELVKIQDYYKTYLLNGNTNNLHFIHSVNSKYHNENCDKNEIYSQAMNDFHIFLKNLEIRIRKNETKNNELGLTKISNDVKDKPKNKSININTDIFTNDDSSDFFIEFITKVKLIPASFACIYSELKPLNGIKNNVSKLDYCRFISDYYKDCNINLNLNDIKSKSRNKKYSQIIEQMKRSYIDKAIKIPFKN